MDNLWITKFFGVSLDTLRTLCYYSRMANDPNNPAEILPHLNVIDPKSLTAHIDVVGYSLSAAIHDIRINNEEVTDFARVQLLSSVYMLEAIVNRLMQAHNLELHTNDSLSILTSGKTSAERIIETL